jgi:hypothetical protein
MQRRCLPPLLPLLLGLEKERSHAALTLAHPPAHSARVRLTALSRLCEGFTALLRLC